MIDSLDITGIVTLLVAVAALYIALRNAGVSIKERQQNHKLVMDLTEQLMFMSHPQEALAKRNGANMTAKIQQQTMEHAAKVAERTGPNSAAAHAARTAGQGSSTDGR